MIKILKYGFIGWMILSSLSCKRIKNKTKELSDKVAREILLKVDKVANKKFPQFDHKNPNTDTNKKLFKNFLKVEITPDIKEIYCFNDAIGIDVDYMFSFKCKPETSKKIIKVHGFVIDTTNLDNGFSMQHDFEWWDKKRISQLDKYSWTNGKGYHKYFWYDLKNGKAYFFDFDL